jgi:hypothetical protein
MLTDLKGNKIALLLEQQGAAHMAFAMTTDSEGVEHEVSSVAVSQEEAIRALGRNIYNRYVLETRGEIPRGERFFKADSF